MPYYKWNGVNLAGESVRGRLFACSQQELDGQLFKKQIALLSSRRVRSYLFFARVNDAQRLDVFRQLVVLINAGVLLPEALSIVAQQTHHAVLEESMHIITLYVREGNLLSDALRFHPAIADVLTVHLMNVGERSGTLGSALEAVCAHLQARHEHYRDMRSALTVPCVTLVFFILVSLAIIVFVIPQFASMFTTFGRDVPALTKMLMRMSAYITSVSLIWLMAGVIMIIGSLCLLKNTKNGKFAWERLIMHTPYVGRLVTCRWWGYCFESVGFLLSGGLQLVPALSAVQDTVANTTLKQSLSIIINQVRQGNSLSYALHAIDDAIISPDIIAMIRVGQETGTLDMMLKQVGRTYQSKAKQLVSFLSIVIQPLCIAILGLLILFLVIAIYMPILNMSYAI